MGEPMGFFSETVPGRRGEILDAAMAVFDEKGFDAGTMREIASRVGVSEPALYRHFAGKEALFTEVMTLAAERFVDEARANVTSIDPQDLPGSLRRVIEDRRLALERYMPLARILIGGAIRRDDFRRLLTTHMAIPMRESLLTIVPKVDASRGLVFSAEQTAARVRAFMAMFVGWYATSMVLGDDDPAPIIAGLLKLMGWT